MASTDPSPPSQSPSSPSSPQPRRRFRPEPFETSTTRSTRDPLPPASNHTPPARNSPGPEKRAKRFKAEPIETSTHSNRASQRESDSSHQPSMASSDSSTSSKTPARRKFAPQPIETSSRSNKPAQENAVSENTNAKDTSKKPARRKFKVELLETATRSRKAGDPAPADILVGKKNKSLSSDVLNEDGTLSPRPSQQRAVSNPTIPLSQLLKPAPNRQGSMHPHYNTRAPSRAHSFRVPDLESIASSESDRSGANSPASTTHSYKDLTRMRESVDDRFSGYLLALAARAAEKQLREQEAALFPSTDAHEPIAHYVDGDESEEADADSPSRSTSNAAAPKQPFRRDSDGDQLALKELQRHGEMNKKGPHRRAPTSLTGQRKRTGAFNVEFDSEAKQDAWIQTPAPKNIIGGYQNDPDLKQMRKAASPPMLGGDMEFPRCPSPDHARFDVTQGSEYLRNSMCYLNTQEHGGDQRLWDGKSNRTQLQRAPATTGRMAQSKDNKKAAKPMGLWGGHCNVQDAKMFATPIGLVTPKASPSLERDDPFSQLTQSVSAPPAGSSQPSTAQASTVQVTAVRTARMPPSPPASNSSHTRDAAADAKLAEEFPDSFVTQVYNYLSLGFPALARKFDEELAKISGVPMVELRRDDKLADQRGYIRLGADEVGVGVRKSDVPGQAAISDCDSASATDPGDEVEVHETMCRRWLALRLYVREWGRQMGVADPSGDMTKLDPRRAWGLPARKGSWAQ